MPQYDVTLGDEEDLFPEIEVATPEQLAILMDGDESAHEITDGDPTGIILPVLPEDLSITLADHRSLFASAPIARASSAFTSKEKDVHRVLKRGSRGEDVEAVKRAALRRLDARGIERDISTNNFMHEKDLDGIDTALYFLGALQETVNKSELTIGAQEMVRHPGTRNDEQLKRARVRMDQLIKDREAREREKEKEKPSTGVVDLRKQMLSAFSLAYRNARAVHYTQGGLRWQGINRNLRAKRGQYPNYADCSSLYTWAWWNAIGQGPDRLNGARWLYGYTGTLATHGARIGTTVLGAAILYGNGWPYVHVTGYCGGGYCLSHGSEAGPLKVPYNYRPIGQVRKHV
jgi:hypothetical protein